MFVVAVVVRHLQVLVAAALVAAALAVVALAVVALVAVALVAVALAMAVAPRQLLIQLAPSVT